MSKRNIFPVDKSLEQPERVMLVGVMLSADYSGANEVRERTFQTTLDEAAELVAAAGGELVLRETAKRDKAHTAYFVGTGKAEELAAAVKLHDIGLAVFNHELTPTQERNLEKILQCRVLDRVGLILAIFAKRAQSQEGKLQVELAQLNHLSGRLVRGYGHLQSQKGGIGLKGPGETQLETDRRLIGQKITALKKQLAQVKKQRATRRKSRMEGRLKTFATPLEQIGTEFQKQAWDALLAIPYGETRSYKEQAQRLGNPKAVRAVAAANGQNKVSILIPCHRVIGSDGKLTGYAGGLNRKQSLLAL